MRLHREQGYAYSELVTKYNGEVAAYSAMDAVEAIVDEDYEVERRLRNLMRIVASLLDELPVERAAEVLNRANYGGNFVPVRYE